MAPKIAIVFWSLYGHVQKLAEAEAEGIRAAGGSVDMYQLPETLPQEVLTKMHAPPKVYIPINQVKADHLSNNIIFRTPTSQP